MLNHNKLVLFFLFSTVLLLLRDTPYLNVFVIERLWVVYLLMLFWIFSHYIPKKANIFFIAIFSLLSVSIIFSLLGIGVIAEAVGIAVYCLLWLIVIQNIIQLIRSETHN